MTPTDDPRPPWARRHAVLELAWLIGLFAHIFAGSVAVRALLAARRLRPR